MRVALVIPHARAALGGAERYTLRLAATLAGRGCAVAIVAASHDEPAGWRAVRLDVSARTRRGWYAAFDSAAVAATAGFDVVHAMMPIGRCDVYHPQAGLAAAGPAGLVPTSSAWSHRLDPKRRLVAAIERRLFAGDAPPVLAAMSREMVGQAAALLDARRVELVGDAIDVADFADLKARQVPEAAGVNPRPELRDAPVTAGRGFAPAASANGDGGTLFLIVANNFVTKGVPAAIRAVAAVPGARLAVVGGGDARACRRLAGRLGAADRVSFAGPAADARPFFAAADALLLPARHEVFGLTPAEAAAAGVPAAISPRAGIASWFTDGVDCLIPGDPGDADAWAAAVRRLCDPGERRRLAEGARRLAPAFDFAPHADRLLAIYRNLR